MAPLKILIVGCSIAGPTLASFLLLSQAPAAERPQITVLERSPAVRKEGQNIDIRGSGAAIIRKLGLTEAVKAASTREQGVQHVDSANRVWAQIAADKTGRVQTPTSDTEVLRGHLADICWRSSQRVSKLVETEGGHGITYIFGDYLSSIEQDNNKVHVKFTKSGKSESFDLLVGADGLQSKTRRMVWGESSDYQRVHKLGAYVGFFSMPRGETDTLWRRWYHAPGARGVAVRPDSINNRTTVFMSVMSETDPRLLDVATNGQRSVNEQKQLLEEYFCNSGWECPRIIKQLWASTDFYYDMIAQVKMDSWSKGRVVLLGDAGYCASPFSGMGTTLALFGAYNLAGLITRHAGDLSKAFSEYERTMRPLVNSAQKLPPGMPRIMHPKTLWGVWALNLFGAFLTWSRISMILFWLKGPSASAPAIMEDFGFYEIPEMAV